MEYKPERFLKDGKPNPDVLDPNMTSFGFGRRICPGRFFANNSLFSIIAHVLSVYDIRPALDENGNEVTITPDMSTGLLSWVPLSWHISTSDMEGTLPGIPSLLHAGLHQDRSRLRT